MKAIIVEDNPSAANVLKLFLDEYPGRIELCGTATTLAEARALITTHRPDLWLLDIRIQDNLVFSLLHEFSGLLDDRVSIIFLTGYYEPEYLHEALKVAAIDYIVKPVDRDLLFAALDKAAARAAKTNIHARISQLEEGMRRLENRSVHARLPVYRVSGEIDYVDKKEVVCIATEDNVTRVLLSGNRNVATTRLLKVYEDLLEGERGFLRVSKQVILNLDYLASFNPKTNAAILKDGSSIQVSRRKAAMLLDVLTGKE
jgi:two-component system LytT family response regulator